ncbi:hypothetical protein GIB67_001730 [Kingdonia uniflora]|uniref:DUF2062 domain-containing protein n=1 Tax=Kingdonia uniflora TaxID=39325 RepID=A0A7J7LMQ4_9MAGN|nr:hypothetical protein GIB67_001730 [Kingdonia uniflora]
MKKKTSMTLPLVVFTWIRWWQTAMRAFNGLFKTLFLSRRAFADFISKGLKGEALAEALWKARGAEPKQLAFSTALGITLGVFPVCGVTVLLCGVAIALLGSRCHSPSLMLANFIATPLELRQATCNFDTYFLTKIWLCALKRSSC